MAVDNITIIKEREFRISENFWFKFKSCNNNYDCDNDDNSMTYSYKSEVSTCIYFPKACNEYGKMV